MAVSKMDEILEYLKKRQQPHAPNVGEIAGAIGMSVESTLHMLTVLQNRGYISWLPGKADGGGQAKRINRI